VSRLVAPRPPAVQRDLDAKANTALNAAIAKNPNRPSADHKGEAIDGWPLSYAQAKPVVDAYVPKSEQRDLVDVGGGGIFGKVKGARATIQEFVQAYVLKGFAQPLHALRYKPEKVATRPADDKAARAWEQTNHKRYLAIAKNTRDMYKPLVKMRPTQPEVLAFLASEGLAANMGDSNEEKAAELARGPRIDVRSSYSGSQRDKVRSRIHLFIVYTASNGEQWYLRGGPGEAGEDGLADGYTTADIGRYAPGSLDWDPDASSVTVMTGQAAAGKFDAMVEAAHACDDANVPYQMVTRRVKLEGENCNATAYTILTRAGVPAKRPSGVHPGGRANAHGRSRLSPLAARQAGKRPKRPEVLW